MASQGACCGPLPVYAHSATTVVKSKITPCRITLVDCETLALNTFLQLVERRGRACGTMGTVYCITTRDLEDPCSFSCPFLEPLLCHTATGLAFQQVRTTERTRKTILGRSHYFKGTKLSGRRLRFQRLEAHRLFVPFSSLCCSSNICQLGERVYLLLRSIEYWRYHVELLCISRRGN